MRLISSRTLSSLCIFMLAASLSPVPVHAQQPAATGVAPASGLIIPNGRVSFDSVTPTSRFEFARRTFDKTPTSIFGHFSMPADAPQPIPAMVIAHGSGGVQTKDFERWVPFFNKLGIATLLVDSFTPRHIQRTVDDQSQLDRSANDADLLAALKLLARDPRIDARRIGVIGFSRGGVAAIETAIEPFRTAIIDDELKFAAHVAFYPACNVRYWHMPSPMSGAPIMMALGEKDNYTPPQPCIAYAKTMRDSGLDVEVHVYEGAYHDFDDVTPFFKRLNNATTGRDCPSVEIDPVTWKRYLNLQNGHEFTTYEQLSGDAQFSRCTSRGVFVGSNADAARKAEADVKAFIGRVFRLSPSMK